MQGSTACFQCPAGAFQPGFYLVCDAAYVSSASPPVTWCCTSGTIRHDNYAGNENMMAIIAALLGADPSNFTLSFTRFVMEVHYDTLSVYQCTNPTLCSASGSPLLDQWSGQSVLPLLTVSTPASIAILLVWSSDSTGTATG